MEIATEMIGHDTSIKGSETKMNPLARNGPRNVGVEEGKVAHKCGFHGCEKEFASNDAMRKHARKAHPQWAAANLTDGRQKKLGEEESDKKCMDAAPLMPDTNETSDDECDLAVPLIPEEIIAWTKEKIYRAKSRHVPAKVKSATVTAISYIMDKQVAMLEIILVNKYGESNPITANEDFWTMHTNGNDFTEIIKSYMVDQAAKRTARLAVTNILKLYKDAEYDRLKRKFDEMYYIPLERRRLKRFLDGDQDFQKQNTSAPPIKQGLFFPRNHRPRLVNLSRP
jgi:hypothetical protein